MMKNRFLTVTRRGLLLSGGALAATAALPKPTWAAEPVKMAGIYTVPVEQQWVSRIHVAAEAAKAAGAADAAERKRD